MTVRLQVKLQIKIRNETKQKLKIKFEKNVMELIVILGVINNADHTSFLRDM